MEQEKVELLSEMQYSLNVKEIPSIQVSTEELDKVEFDPKSLVPEDPEKAFLETFNGMLNDYKARMEQLHMKEAYLQKKMQDLRDALSE